MDKRSIIIDNNVFHSYLDFKSLMEKSETLLNERGSKDERVRNLTPSGVEEFATKCIQESCQGTNFSPGEIMLVSHTTFPDIIAAGKYGVEVKTTKSNHWTSVGSSILESTRPKSVEQIYMLFGKLGGCEAEFKCRPYEEVLSDITVTHSPRYLIDMRLAKGETIFDRMNTTYDEFRVSDNSIGTIRRYYRSLFQEDQSAPWWLTNEQDDRGMGIGVRTWDTLNTEEKENLRSLFLLLFSEQILQRKYKSIALWTVAAKSILLYNARDFFSAGGKLEYAITPSGSKKLLSKKLPKSYGFVVNGAASLKTLLMESPDFFSEAMGYAKELCPKIDTRSPEEAYSSWLELIGSQSTIIPLKPLIVKNHILI